MKDASRRRLALRGLLAKRRIEHKWLEKRLVFGRAVSQQPGGFTAISRVSSSRKWTNRKTVVGEIDGACPNCTGDVFHWLNIWRRRKRHIEASASREHITYRIGNFIKAQRPLRYEYLAIGFRNIEASVMCAVEE